MTLVTAAPIAVSISGIPTAAVNARTWPDFGAQRPEQEEEYGQTAQDQNWFQSDFTPLSDAADSIPMETRA
jgi:hypothetical protein